MIVCQRLWLWFLFSFRWLVQGSSEKVPEEDEREDQMNFKHRIAINRDCFCAPNFTTTNCRSRAHEISLTRDLFHVCIGHDAVPRKELINSSAGRMRYLRMYLRVISFRIQRQTNFKCLCACHSITAMPHAHARIINLRIARERQNGKTQSNFSMRKSKETKRNNLWGERMISILIRRNVSRLVAGGRTWIRIRTKQKNTANRAIDLARVSNVRARRTLPLHLMAWHANVCMCGPSSGSCASDRPTVTCVTII